jgi:hypothetical protein
VAALEKAAEQAVPGLADEPAWPTLRARLLLLSAAGIDPVAQCQPGRPAPHRSNSATQGGPDLAAPPRPGGGRRCGTRVAGVATAGRTARTEHKRGQFRADAGRALGRHLTCRGGRQTAAARGCARKAGTGRSCRSGAVVADLPSSQPGPICPNQPSRRPYNFLGIQACRAHWHRPCAAHPDQSLVARPSYGSRRKAQRSEPLRSCPPRPALPQPSPLRSPALSRLCQSPTCQVERVHGWLSAVPSSSRRYHAEFCRFCQLSEEI